MSRSASPSLLVMQFRKANLPMQRSSFSTWTRRLLEVFSAIKSVFVLLMIRPSCFAKTLSHRALSCMFELVRDRSAKSLG